MDDIYLRQAQPSDIETVLYYIDKLKLDGENADPEQFIIAEVNGNFAGFGRIKPYENLSELSSIGVLKEYRGKGVGEKIIKHLIDKFPEDEIWITTKKPEYFKKFGFEESDIPPDEILQKCHRVCARVCESAEHSCFMCLKKNSAK